MPRELFSMGRFPGPHASGANYWSYAVSADGQQFVAARGENKSTQTQEAPIAVVLNWAAALKK